MGSLPVLWSVCSVALVPVSLLAGRSAFLALVAINFVLLHAIWLVPRIRGYQFTEQFFRAQMRAPLILFMIGGLAGLVAL